MGLFDAKGRGASKLRQRKFKLIRRYGLPENIVGGSLARTFRRCGKPTCHCSAGKGHPIWLLTHRVDGEKRNEVIPEALLSTLRPLVDEGRELRNAIADLLSINAQLLRLGRQEQRAKRSRQAKSPRKKAKTPRRR